MGRRRNKHQKTLEAIFSRPTSGTIKWDDIESLLVSLGAIIVEERGSRVSVKIGERVANFHRPHPQKEARKYAVDDVRDFLTELGVHP